MGRFFGLEDKEVRHAYVEESFIADVQFEISKMMKRKSVSRAELARRLGVSASYVTQMLGNEDSNLTLRTVARIFGALGEAASISSAPAGEKESKSAKAMNVATGPSAWAFTCANDAWSPEEDVEFSGEDRLSASERSVVWLSAIQKVAQYG